MLDDAGAAGMSIAAVTSRAGVEPTSVAPRIDALVAAKQAVRAADTVVAAAVFARLKEAIVAALGAHHRAQPISDGIPREALREQLFAHGAPAVFDLAVAELAASQSIVARDRVALVLRYYQDASYEEIGDALGIAPASVGPLLSRARAKVREALA